ncbi:MAG: type VI secretion system baseplate subunit TssF [Nitrospirae bacterium]|nr:type VI secretion system baseplate subunit TssF [Nitrospirota bacterium]
MSTSAYEQELANLRVLAKEFASAHPAVAPMLGQPSADPDVERLLEGVAFLTSILHQRLTDHFPEFVQEIAQVLFSQFLRPVPCATILSFSPKGKLTETVRIPRGTRAGSSPVDGTTCYFETCQEIDLHPLTVSAVKVVQEAGRPASIHLTLSGMMPLAQLAAPSLSFYLGGPYSEGSNLFYHLTQNLESIEILAPGEPSTLLSPGSLRASSFGDDSALFPYSPNSFSAYRLFQEFFVMPAKFLFVELSGLSAWRQRGTGSTATVIFRLTKSPARPLNLQAHHFVLGAVPAVNLFEMDAEPMSLTHRQSEIPIRLAAGNRDHFDVFSIEQVTGVSSATGKTSEYRPFHELLGQERSLSSRAYRVVRRASKTEARAETYMGILYGKGEVPTDETLSVRVRATNRMLPEALKPGEINRSTDNSPERLLFSNLTSPTPYIQPPLEDALTWRILSQLGINFLSLGDASRLRALLSIYVFPMERNKGLEDTNRKRIDSLEEVRLSRKDRFIRGVLLRGTEIMARVRGDGFPDLADLYLFGTVLNEFLSVYATINTFIKLEIENALTGERLSWPERLGTQTLI